MFERFTDEARTVVVHAQEHARRLGHRYIGCEHLLLAMAGNGQPAGDVLREHGVTPDRVEEEIVRQVGLGAGASLFAGLDRSALAAIGVDLDAVRARIEGSFGTDELTRAAHAVHCRRPPRRHPGTSIPATVAKTLRLHRAKRQRAVPIPKHPPATGRYRAEGPLPTGHLPFTPRAKKVLEKTLREALARHDHHIGAEHIVLAMTTMDSGLVPPILAALGAHPPALRAGVIDRYRKAS